MILPARCFAPRFANCFSPLLPASLITGYHYSTLRATLTAFPFLLPGGPRRVFQEDGATLMHITTVVQGDFPNGCGGVDRFTGLLSMGCH